MDNTLDFNKLKEYLNSLAEAYEGIDTFVGFQEKELHTVLNQKFDNYGTILVPFKYEGELNGNNQRTLAGRVIHFGILQNVTKEDYNEESIVIAECERIGFDILSRINYDSRKENSRWLYKNFDQNTVEFNEIRLKSSKGLVGMGFHFTLKTPQPLSVDITKWSDLDAL